MSTIAATPATNLRTPSSDAQTNTMNVQIHTGKKLETRIAELCGEGAASHPARDLRWLRVLRDGLRQVPYLLEAQQSDGARALLPLMYVKSLLFGKFLVGMPYLNSGGVDEIEDSQTALALIDAATELADRLDCRHLELRHERAVPHPAFNAENGVKVHMRLPLPETADILWDQLKSKLRSQVRKGLKEEFQVEWGGENLLDEFYTLFAKRMHELGTPVYSRALFASLLHHFGSDAELCCVRLNGQPVASAVLVHGRELTEVPSAAALTERNSTNANMVMYWHLLSRGIERGSRVFDFGRASAGSGTYKFKEQWGAQPSPAVWQYYVRHGSADDLRPDNTKNQRRIELWKKLPHWVTRWIGPTIVRGIP